MSTDPSGIVYLGFPLPDFDGDYHDINDEWEDLKAPPRPDYIDDRKAPEWDVWRAELQRWSKSADNIRIDWSGAEDCEAFYLHCDGFKREAEWSEQKPLSLTLSVGEELAVNANIKEFCERFSLPLNEIRWYLAARYF